jgi:transposase-like protein
LLPSDAERRAIAARLGAKSSDMGRATMAEIARRHDWFSALGPEHRSWVALVAQAGIAQFIAWFADESDEPVSATDLFDAAPRRAMRRIALFQTVELLRTTTDVVEDWIGRMPPDDQPVLTIAINHFSREAAFAAADLYARVADTRSSWDSRLEALVVDGVVRGEIDEEITARATALGWSGRGGVVVVAGRIDHDADETIERVRDLAYDHEIDVLAAPRGSRLVVILGGAGESPDEGRAVIEEMTANFAEGPVVFGPAVAGLSAAAVSAHAALAGLRAAPAWPEAPRPVSSDDLLPERVVSGDAAARRRLAERVYEPLEQAGHDLIATLDAYVNGGASIEATARTLFIHPNTVRYRLGRISDLTGFNPAQPRGGLTLRLGLAVGRLDQAGSTVGHR